MEKKQTAKYIVCDTLSAMLAWAALFAFRKMMVGVEWSALVSQVLTDNTFWIGVVAVPAGWLVLYTIQGMYRNVLRRARLKELIETLIATVIGVLVIFFVLMMDDEVVTYRNHYASFLFLLGVHFVLTYVPRMLITSQTVRRVHSRQIGFPTLMIGNGRKALQTYLDLENQETYSGEQFVGCIALNQEHSELEKMMPCVGTMEGLREVVEQYHVEEAMVAVEDNEREKVSEILRALDEAGDMIIKITPDARDLMVGSIKQESIFHSPLIIINNRLMDEWQYSLKRIFDVIISVLAMVLLSPVYLVTAIIVKCTSPGPVFYAQERIGYHGKPFKMHKFRSMYVDAEESGPALSKDNDPRITPFGRFMRKVRLDDIPQFYNVLKGTMSLVGPRPERQFYIDQIVKRAPEYLLLQRVKPGITSWGQVKYGYASTVDEMVERLRYDLLYLDNMSLTTDLKILLYTSLIIMQGRGK
jgi:exopolysaccharide biosynthesis polyprenyl glycosylphosphotransferase